jgi:UDP-GlcNAc:undecaprenyl-phosphate/decaprenyl-phosphate GlcNAc-1-phosphate transferase
MKDYLYILIIAAVVTYLLTPLVRLGAIAVKAQHEPRDRDVHVKPTPLLGGIAMYGGLVAGLLVADRLTYLQQAFPSSRTITGLLLAGGLLVLIGAMDDRFGLGVIARLAGQIAAGGIIVWSGAALPWIPWPGSQTFTLEPDLSYTLTILLIVATINAVNFIDGLDGLAAGVVAISAVAYMVYSYTLTNSVGIPSQSVPALASAVLAGVCIGFLPHNFNPARIFMGDSGAYLLGLLLAYGPIQSTATLDQNILVNYSHGNPINRFPTILPLLLPIAIWLIPYTDMLLAVVRRTWAGKSPFAADGQHLHHRLLNMGHSQRMSVLLMYLWAALFSGLVVGLSVLRLSLIWFALATLVAMGALLLATAPKLRPWHTAAPGKRRKKKRGSPVRSAPEWTVTSTVAAPGNGRAPGSPPPPVFPTRNPAPRAAPAPPVNRGPMTRARLSTGPASTGPVSTGPVSTGPVNTGPVNTGPVAQAPFPPLPVSPPPVGPPPASPPSMASLPLPPPPPFVPPPWSSRP